jgi:hypothetical protein
MVLTIEELLGSHGVLVFVKSFKEGSKVTIVCLGRNAKGRFVEVAAYGVVGQRGFLLITEGWGGWGWIKFVGELSKAKDFLAATIGCGFDSLPVEKEGGKKVGPGAGNRPSFVVVVRANASVSLVGVLKGKTSALVITSGDQPLVPSLPEMDWCEVENFVPLR